jgi:predicted ATPase with chaperone activity
LLTDNNGWEKVYKEALLEVDSQKVPQRVAAAREAIAGRLRDLEHDSDHHAERSKIEKVLNLLDILESDA